jgi:hypothetical protein
MNKNKIVFIDESGDEGNIKGKSSDYYVVLALIVAEEEYPQLLQHFKSVRAKRFQRPAEMKSETIGNDSVRRKEIINHITQKPFELFVLIVDKSKLTSTGFCYAQSFVKYLHGRLYQNIMADLSFVQIKADNIKSKAFTNEIRSYIEKKNPKTLFSDWSIEFLNSKDNECIQVCDVLSGTIRRCVEKRETPEDKGIYVSYIKERSYMEIFPYSEHKYLYEIVGDEKSDYDIQIEKRAVEEAYRYINAQKDNSEREIQQQIHCMQILLSDYFINNGDNWVSTSLLEAKIGEEFNETIGDQKLRGIIGGLRDNNVLIASKRTGGYKIPTCLTDLYEYLNTQNMMIAPMVSRIKRASDMVKRATNGNMNILEKQEFKNLKKIIEVLPQLEI